MPLELDYGSLRGHEAMLRDSVRCEAFRRAIIDTVTPGCAVLDIGAGTGILSLFAAQAGAKVVYAVEQTRIAELARRIVSENGFGDRINVLQSDMGTIELPEKVDVIVSEWLGGYGVDENLLPIVVRARDRWLKPGGRLIPETVTSWIVPAYDKFLQQDVDFWSSEPYGISLNAIGQATARQLDCGAHHVRQEHILCDPQLMWEVDGMACSREDADQPFSCRLEFVADRDGQFNALAAWFRAQLSKQIVLCNGPSERDTHWGRTMFPVGKTVSVERGMRVDVHFVLEPQGRGQTRAVWSIEVEGYRFHAEGITVLTDQNAACEPPASADPAGRGAAEP
jgi:SAM-dependent methyltransferase